MAQHLRKNSIAMNWLNSMNRFRKPLSARSQRRLWMPRACGLGLFILLSVWGTYTFAATCNSASGGTWSTIARWSCGHVPLANDDVFVLNTHIVTIDTAAVAQNVTVNTGGILRFATAAAH